jgi:hypothetical protein
VTNYGAITLPRAATITDCTFLFTFYDGEVVGGTDNHALTVGFSVSW